MKIVIANAKGPIYIKFCLKVILTFYTYACSAMSVGTLVYNTCECFVCYKEERSIIQNKMESLPLLVFKMMGKGVLPLQIQIVNIDSHKFNFLKIIV